MSARQTAQREGVILKTELVEGDVVQAIMECVQKTKAICLCWACTQAFLALYDYVPGKGIYAAQ